MNISTLPRNSQDKALREFAEHGLRVRIQGNCMVPTLNNGDSVEVRSSHKYKIGDILVVRLANGQLVSHRLLGVYRWKGRRHFMTRPDNGNTPDCSVTHDSIIGKVMTTASDHPLPVTTSLYRCQLYLSFLYCLCRRMFAKIQYAQKKKILLLEIFEV